MSLIKWEPLGEIDRFFDDRLLPTFSTLARPMGYDLAVDVYEEKGNVIAKMSLPGMQSDDVDISIEDNLLSISGHREEEKETKDKDYYSKEIRRGAFSRTITLPNSVTADKAEATFKDGILIVTMPAVVGAKNKAVKVKISQ